MKRCETIRDAIRKGLRRSIKPMTCTDLQPHVPEAYDHNEIARELSRMYEHGELDRVPAGAGYKRIRFAYQAKGVLPGSVEVSGSEQQQIMVMGHTTPLPLPGIEEPAATTGRPRIRVRGNPDAMTITDQGSAVVIALPGFEVTVEAA